MPTDVARALGDLEGTVRSLKEQWERQDTAAREGRRVLHDKFDALTVQVHNLTGVAYGVQQDVAEIKNEIDEKIMPTVNAYALDKARIGGMIDTGKLVKAAILSFCVLIGWFVHEALQYLAKGGSIPGVPLH